MTTTVVSLGGRGSREELANVLLDRRRGFVPTGKSALLPHPLFIELDTEIALQMEEPKCRIGFLDSILPGS